jgi:hypothetical protein
MNPQLKPGAIETNLFNFTTAYFEILANTSTKKNCSQRKISQSDSFLFLNSSINPEMN